MASKYTLPVDDDLPLSVHFWTESPNTIDCVVYLKPPGAISWTRLMTVNSPEEVIRSDQRFALAPLAAKTTLWLQIGAIGTPDTPFLVGLQFLQDEKVLPVTNGSKPKEQEITFEGTLDGISWVADIEVRLT